MKIELSHDILARKIYEKSSSEDKMLLKLENLIKSDYERYQERNLLMASEDYEYVFPFLDNLTITAEERDFVDRSGRSIKRKQRTLNIIIIAVIAMLALFGALASYQSYLASEKAMLIQDKNNKKSLSSNFVTSVLRLPNNDLWIGTESGGICKVEENNGVFEFFPFFLETFFKALLAFLVVFY